MTPGQGFLANHGYASPPALLWVVVPQGMMQCAAIVPDRYRIFRPPEATLEIDSLNVAKQKLQQSLAFFLWEHINAFGEFPVNEQCRSARVAMFAYDRVMVFRPPGAFVICFKLEHMPKGFFA
jgi:hypothetical protein